MKTNLVHFTTYLHFLKLPSDFETKKLLLYHIINFHINLFHFQFYFINLFISTLIKLVLKLKF